MCSLFLNCQTSSGHLLLDPQKYLGVVLLLPMPMHLFSLGDPTPHAVILGLLLFNQYFNVVRVESVSVYARCDVVVAVLINSV